MSKLYQSIISSFLLLLSINAQAEQSATNNPYAKEYQQLLDHATSETQTKLRLMEAESAARLEAENRMRAAHAQQMAKNNANKPKLKLPQADSTPVWSQTPDQVANPLGPPMGVQQQPTLNNPYAPGVSTSNNNIYQPSGTNNTSQQSGNFYR